MNEIEITNLLLLAYEAYRNNEDEEAKEYYSQVLEKDNNNLIALIYRGNSNRMLGKYNEAFDDFTRAEELLGDADAYELRKFLSWRFEEVKRAKLGIENYLKEANIVYKNKEYRQAAIYYSNMPNFPYSFDRELGEFVIAVNEDFKKLSYATKLQICVRLVVCKLHDETLDVEMLKKLKGLIKAINDDLIAPAANEYADTRMKSEDNPDEDVNKMSETFFYEYIDTEPTASAFKILKACKSEIKRRLDGNDASAQFYAAIEEIDQRQDLIEIKSSSESTPLEIEAYFEKANAAYKNKTYAQASSFYLSMFNFPYGTIFLMSKHPEILFSNSFLNLSYEWKLQSCMRFLECKLHDMKLDEAALKELLSFNEAVDEHIITVAACAYVDYKIGPKDGPTSEETELEGKLLAEFRATEPTASVNRARDVCRLEINRRLNNFVSPPKFFRTMEQINKKRTLDVPEQEFERSLKQKFTR